MKILHVAECAGGVERYLQMLLPLLEKQKLTQVLLCSFSYDRKKYEGMIDGIVQMDMRQSFSPQNVVRNIMGIRRCIRSVRPDIVYCHSSFAGGLGRLASVGMRCKVVYNPHGWAFNMK